MIWDRWHILRKWNPGSWKIPVQQVKQEIIRNEKQKQSSNHWFTCSMKLMKKQQIFINCRQESGTVDISYCWKWQTSILKWALYTYNNKWKVHRNPSFGILVTHAIKGPHSPFLNPLLQDLYRSPHTQDSRQRWLWTRKSPESLGESKQATVSTRYQKVFNINYGARSKNVLSNRPAHKCWSLYIKDPL